MEQRKATGAFFGGKTDMAHPSMNTYRLTRLCRESLSHAWLLFVCLTLAGCATPVGVKRVDPQTVHRKLTSNVLSTGKLSERTQIILNQRDLALAFQKQPEEAISKLHAHYVSVNGDADDLAALAEMCFLYAESSGKSEYYFACAIYAYAFLFPEDQADSPSPYDPRLRLACDLYNRSITLAFKTKNGTVDLRGGSFYLPFGYIEIQFDKSSLIWNQRSLVQFMPVAELEVRGLANRYRWPGIGAPLSAKAIPLAGQEETTGFVAPNVRMPITALLIVPEPRKQITQRKLHATLEIYDVSLPESVEIGSREVPLEVESTASLAAMLAESPVWQTELAGFFKSILRTQGTSQLRGLRPYQPGLIPVVMVHGTASSAGRWAEMVNELENDQLIQQHFQFWFFSYDTGNPIPYSASLLRESLTEAVQQFDPQGKDPTLHHMVVMGHSQGGLLTKMTVIDSGDELWNNISKKPIDELDLKESTRQLLQKSLFVKPLPFVRCVISIATPHRGSYIAGWRPSQWITKLIKMPSNILFGVSDLLQQDQSALAFASSGKIPTSVDNMTPGNPFIKTLATIPIAPGVSVHSIIAVKEGMPVEQGNDGVVGYQSAHLQDAESEHVVRSGHSCQANPHTIAEVRRILLEQLKQD